MKWKIARLLDRLIDKKCLDGKMNNHIERWLEKLTDG